MRHLDVDRLADGGAERRDLSPSRRTSSATGSPESAVSSTRASIVCSLPTMPKRGASTSSMRRSRSPSWPVMSACSGALKPSAATSVGNVVDDAVSDEDRRADPVGGNVAEARLQRREQPRALIFAIGLAGVDEAGLDIVERAEALFQFSAHLGRLRGAIADRLAARLIDHDCDDILQRPAVLANQRGIEQS